MILHLLALAHTISNNSFSHCAFTGKIIKFPAMMATLPGAPFEVIHYGVEGADTAASLHVDIMTREEQNALRGHDGTDAAKFVGDDADAGNPLYKEFNARLRKELAARVGPMDLVLLPFGWGHGEAVNGQGFTLVESGIGYPTLYPAPYKIFESYAWMHWHQGRANRSGCNYEWVIPNYFDIDDWQAVPKPDMGRVVFLGRIGDVKGVPTIVELARQRPDLEFVLCGQGDPAPYLSPKTPNLTYQPPLTGRDRSEYLANARACVMPTVFTEPFGGVAVEAMLSGGTPVLSVSYGAFTETIEDRVTGFRCHTLGDWLAALELAPTLDRTYIQRRAQGLYGFQPIAERYQRAFDMIADLKGRGFYTARSVFGPAVVTAKKEAAAEGAGMAAQRKERDFHLAMGCRPYERQKRQQYAAIMGITWEAAEGRRILDIGCGPESLMLLYDVAEGSVALDPLTFRLEDEELYAARGITRAITPAETWEYDGEPFDEVWIYNCLQHTQDPRLIMENAKRWGLKVRLFEWLEVKTDELHLHRFQAEDFRDAFADWTLEHEMSGTWKQGPYARDQYIMGVWNRKEA